MSYESRVTTKTLSALSRSRINSLEVLNLAMCGGFRELAGVAVGSMSEPEIRLIMFKKDRFKSIK